MALKFCDGFDWTTSSANSNISTLLSKKYTLTEIFYSRTGRNGGLSITTQSANGTLTYSSSQNYSTIILGFAINRRVNNSGRLVEFFDLSNLQFYVNYDSVGMPVMYLGNDSFIGAGSSNIPYQTWSYIEFKLTTSNTTGSIQLKLNGELIFSSSNIDTQVTANSYVNRFNIKTGNEAVFIDDLYLCDSTGTSNNDFLGDVQIRSVKPIANGNYSDFNPLSGQNYTNLDENPTDNDTTYNESSVLNDTDTFDFENITDPNISILGIQNSVSARKTQPGIRKISSVLRTNSTDYTTNEQPIADDYTIIDTMYEKNPNTNALWTQTEVNNAELGYKITT